jgi:hypothetical protein
MPISQKLMLSILAMDSYNRGDNQGIKNLPDVGPVGNAAINQLASTEIGSPERTASFFAISYTFGDNAPNGLAGKTVISYRGTDTEFFGGADSPAFAMGTGSYETAQGNLAIDFYKTVNGGNAATNLNIVVTGITGTAYQLPDCPSRAPISICLPSPAQLFPICSTISRNAGTGGRRSLPKNRGLVLVSRA